MIESFRLANVATYDPTGVIVDELKKINFFYGANGCGKTTASNYLTDTTNPSFPNCSVQWKNNQALATLVYNKDFRDHNFGSSDIAGVFTLGQATAEEVEKIRIKKAELENENNQIAGLEKTLSGRDGELLAHNQEFTERCWSIYKKYAVDFKSALKGFIGSKIRFKDKIILESATISDVNLLSLEQLKQKSDTLLGEPPPVYPMINSVPEYNLSDIESNPLWQKIIVGKSDVDISALIHSLGNNDWVNQGQQYIKDDATCPFCQKPTIDDEFKNKLEKYFDDSFLRDIDDIKTLSSSYEQLTSSLLTILKNTFSTEKSNSKSMLDIELFNTNVIALESIIKSNTVGFISKIEKASLQVDVLATRDVLITLQKIIDTANAKLEKHNNLAKDYQASVTTLTKEIWLFLTSELTDDTSRYLKKEAGLSKGISSIVKTKGEKIIKSKEINGEVRELSRNMTSVQPAVDEMNRLLEAYGFLNFRIEPSEKLPNHYCIKRPSGELVENTLSEGEVTFITFLYFYQLARGAKSEDAVAEDRVLVIDDPISSLDSNVLYIVSALVKQLIKEVKSEAQSNIKQFFLLTHNVYFHKEASFQNGRSNGCNQTHFWILRKANNITSITPYYQKNPIESSYELLWRELKERDKSTGITIQNTMRRILENYFKILGKFSDDNIVAKFENVQEQQICNSLLYWINDGSHCLPDDLYIQHPGDTIELYMSVFRKVFLHSGHIAHYKMMMGEEYNDDDINQAA